MPTNEIPAVLKDVAGFYCFGCCAHNPAGLALEFIAEGDGVTCTFMLDRRHESYPGIVHGGIGATVLDEIMGNALVLIEGKVCFTTSMRLRYLAPLRTNRPYRAVGRIVERPERRDGFFRVTGELLDEHDATMLTANASYQWVTAEQANAFMTPSPARSSQFAGYFRPDSD